MMGAAFCIHLTFSFGAEAVTFGPIFPFKTVRETRVLQFDLLSPSALLANKRCN